MTSHPHDRHVIAALADAADVLAEADPDDERLHDITYYACPYARGFGTCVAGCWEEPDCVTTGADYSVSDLLSAAARLAGGAS